MLGNFAYCNLAKLYFGDETLQDLNEGMINGRNEDGIQSKPADGR